MKRSLAAAGALSFALFLSACSGAAEDTTSTPAPMSEATTSEAMATPSETAAQSDIVDTAVGAGNFTTLVTAVQAAGLEDDLRGDGPFTVFAPTDDAFAALPDGTLDQLLADPTGQLADILTYHVVSGEVMAADVVGLDGQQVTTLQGGQFTVEIEGDKVVLVDGAGNRVNVVTTDVQASNGVIHVIDGVLLPSA